MRKFTFAFATILSLSAMAASGPRFAVEDLYKAAKKNKGIEFHSLLTGLANEQIGHADGMALVKAEGDAHGYDFNMEKALVNEAPGFGSIYSIRTYEVYVESDKTKQFLRKPLVECYVHQVRHPGRCYRRCWGPRARHCETYCDPPYTTFEEDNCRISDWTR